MNYFFMKWAFLAVSILWQPIFLAAQDAIDENNNESLKKMTPETIIQQQLETYNSRDIESFMALFSDDVQLHNQADGKLLADGKSAVRALYTNLFENSPNLHSKLLNRMVLANTVIDHEKITGRMGKNEPIELIVIYELKGLKIHRVTVIR